VNRHITVLNLSVALALGLSACLPAGIGQAPTPTTAAPLPTLTSVPETTIPSTAVPEPTETPAPAGGLVAGQLRNATYLFTDLPDRPVQLTDGVQPRDMSDPAGADYRIPGFVEGGEALTLGDLNGDGADDAAVILTADPDGTGVFYHLFVMLSDGGEPVQAAEAFLGDRVALHARSGRDPGPDGCGRARRRRLLPVAAQRAALSP